MEVRQLSVHEREKWDAFVCQEPAFALLQSWAWGEFKARLGWGVYRVAIEEQGQIVAGAQMLVRSLLPSIGCIAYVPRGPVGCWLEADTASLLFSELHRIARQHRALFLRLEPPLTNTTGVEEILKQNHFQPGRHPNQPRATLILDLEQDLEDIYAQFRKSTRKDIEKSIRAGVTVRFGDEQDLPAFCDLMQITARREHFPARSRLYYELEWSAIAALGQASLHLVSNKDQLLAAGMVSCFGAHAAQLHAGSSSKLRHLHPNHVLVWERIKWAKARGCRTYDLWGIPDEIGEMVAKTGQLPFPNRTDGLWGVYRFKCGFCKNLVVYIGAYDFIYKLLPYALMNNKWINRNVLDHLAVQTDPNQRWRTGEGNILVN